MAEGNDAESETARPGPLYQRTKPRRRTWPGAPPGQLIADPHAHDTAVSVIAYGAEDLHEADTRDFAEIERLKAAYPVVWVDVVGLKDVAFIRELGAAFGIHPLALEDVVNVHQRAKTEAYEHTLYTVVRIPESDRGGATEQISIALGEGLVVTFQERPGDPFAAVRRRIEREGSLLRESAADYLVYALVDAAIDAYFPALEALGERLEALEAAVIAHPDSQSVGDIHLMKHELLAMRRAIWPHREMVNALMRHDSPLIGESVHPYLRDCYDHAVQLMEIVETYREIASGLLDVYLSSLSNRMNEIMKVLTIIATIFIPLSFIAGVYGMNFDAGASPWNMPELGWRYGYPAVLGGMALVGFGLLYWFRRRGWIGGRR